MKKKYSYSVIVIVFICCILGFVFPKNESYIIYNSQPDLCIGVCGEALRVNNNEPFYIEIKSPLHLNLVAMKYGMNKERFASINKHTFKNNKVYLVLMGISSSGGKENIAITNKKSNVICVEYQVIQTSEHQDIMSRGFLIALDRKKYGDNIRLNIKYRNIEREKSKLKFGG